ncbi:MAG: hypothetical protein WCD35_07255 [Mycobacteriales bacterium]
MTSVTGLLLVAPSASAQVPAPDPVGGGNGPVVVPVTHVVHDAQGLQWWAIVLIALAAAALAAVVTEVVDTLRQRHHGVSMAHV